MPLSFALSNAGRITSDKPRIMTLLMMLTMAYAAMSEGLSLSVDEKKNIIKTSCYDGGTTMARTRLVLHKPADRLADVRVAHYCWPS